MFSIITPIAFSTIDSFESFYSCWFSPETFFQYKNHEQNIDLLCIKLSYVTGTAKFFLEDRRLGANIGILQVPGEY